MKTRAFLISVLFVGISLAACSTVQLVKTAKPGDKGVKLKWLGTAGWEIRTGTTTILIDPFLTRKVAIRNAEWKTDEDAVLKEIKEADYIFAGHSHADHIADIPFIAKRFGSKIIGSRTTTNLALTAGVDKEQVVTIRGGEKLDFKEFSVQVIKSEHRIKPGRTQPRRLKEIEEPFHGPILGSHFLVGGSFLYYFKFGKHRVLHQSTPNFLENNLTGLNPDVALLAEGHRSYVLRHVLNTLKPEVIIIHHFDEWRVPFSEGLQRKYERRAQRFEQDIAYVDNRIQVIIPEFLKPYNLE